jgi:bifunctional enzyme CysN/CysC
VQDIYRFDERRIVAGRVETGTLRVGDELVFSPANKTTTVQSIERWNAPGNGAASSGDSIGLTLTEQIFVERGYVASHQTDTPIETNRFHADLFWIAKEPMRVGRPYDLRLATQEVKCQIVSIDEVMDSSTLDRNTAKRDRLERNEVGKLIVQTRAPLVLDNHDRIPSLGRFIIANEGQICGGGIIFGGTYTDRTVAKSKNIFWTEGKITRRERAAQMGHRGAVIWFTGLSGAGKSTIAQALERDLFRRGIHTYVLDGDNVRHGLNSNLGFTPEDRFENIRRVSEVARLMADSGVVVVTAFISPYRMDRRRAREIALEGHAEFIEVFVDAPLEVCEARDPKQLYKKARAGQIRQFTGIDAPYEPPEDPEIVVHTDRQSVEESIGKILEHLLPRLKSEEVDD